MPKHQRNVNEAAFHPPGCNCGMDHGFELREVGPNDFSLDPYAGLATYRTKEIATLDRVVEQIDSGRTLAANNNVITYTFLDPGRHLIGLYNNPTIGFEAGLGLGSFSGAQRAEARQSIELWDDLIPQSFRETNGLGADIQFANSADPAQAYAYYPGKQGWKFQSDVFVADPALNWTNNWLGFGGYGATTLVHELGHSLGLSHPGAYNFGPGFAVTYANGAEYAQDSEQYSIMSYWSPEETGARIIDFSSFFFNNAQTPMIHDILTIQAKYGADPTTRVGDTVYGWNSNAGNDVFDFSKNLYPHVAIYDAGGNDTIDMSGANASVFINLNAGSFSSGAADFPAVEIINARRAELSALGAGPIAPLTQAAVNAQEIAQKNNFATLLANPLETGITGLLTTSKDNISIAYGVTIENATGSSERDYLLGNQVANVLKGLGGNDVLDGGAGADTLEGGAGADTFRLWNVETGDAVSDFLSGVDKLDLSGIDAVAGTAGNQAFTFLGGGAFSGVAGQLRFSDGQLQGDVDGDGVADLIVFFTNGATPAPADIVL